MLFIVKYISGYGCVILDSYFELLRIGVGCDDFDIDFVFFKVFNIVLMVMMVYVVYEVYDD